MEKKWLRMKEKVEVQGHTIEARQHFIDAQNQEV